MKITIIVAAFRPEGVKATIENLEAQTYKDFEVIIVNDNVLELRKMVPEWIKDKPNYHFLDNYTRCHLFGGVSRNMAITMAFTYTREGVQREDKDTWIMIHDDDVEYYPDFIEKVVNYHNKYPEKDMIGVNIEVIGKKDKNYIKIMHNAIALQNTDINAWAYKKDLFKEYGLFPCSIYHKVTYDWLWIKNVVENIGLDKFGFIEGEPKLKFFHKKH